jgi:putative DNA primase/helicase
MTAFDAVTGDEPDPCVDGAPGGDALTALRLGLFANGYAPIPVASPDFVHQKVKSPGKQPFFRSWQNLTPDTLVGADIDVALAEMAGQIARMAEAMPGATPLIRIGNAPKRMHCYRATTALRKIETAELYLPDDSKAQVEILGVGEQFVAYGIHPDTRRPYYWPQQSPLDVPLADLPIVTEAALRGFVAAAEAVLRAAGARTRNMQSRRFGRCPPRVD